VPLRLVNDDSSEIARVSFTYYTPPSIISALLDSAGLSILVTFDQLTNRAGATVATLDCARIFPAITSFGTGVRCVWQAEDSLVVFLGTGASITPGDVLAVNATSNLRGKNGASDAATISFPVSVTSTPQPPLLTVTGPNSIDACSSLEVRAAASSPRPLLYRWRCLNDEALDVVLRALSGPVFVSGEGTPELRFMDKTYQIAVEATDFLGATSRRVTALVSKTSVPSPQISFTPPSLSVMRNEVALIKAEAFFSACPSDTSQLVFTWLQVSGPSIPLQYLTTPNPQLLLPANILDAGATYVLSLGVIMSADKSVSSRANFVLKTGTYVCLCLCLYVCIHIHRYTYKSVPSRANFVLKTGKYLCLFVCGCN
jgi:hypothetical protein